MKYVGYIGTVLSLMIAFAFQQLLASELIKFLSWAVPGTVAGLGWIFSLILRARQLRELVVKDVRSSIEQTINEKLTAMEGALNAKMTAMESTLNIRMTTMECAFKLDVSTMIDEKLDAMKKEVTQNVVDEVWYRIDNKAKATRRKK